MNKKGIKIEKPALESFSEKVPEPASSMKIGYGYGLLVWMSYFFAGTALLIMLRSGQF